MNRMAQTLQTDSASNIPLHRGILQRKCDCGNQMIAKYGCAECEVKQNSLQRKLSIGASNDPLEYEADRVAQQVMSKSSSSVISNAPIKIQRLSNSKSSRAEAVPSSVQSVLASSGSAMHSGLRQNMEQRFGHDFSQVRIHTGSTAAKSARDVNAHAYTTGHNVVFGEGQYAPGTYKGKRLLAHELTHVVQQKEFSLQHNIQRDALEINYEELARNIEDAVSGLGTDEEAIYRALTRLQRNPESVRRLEEKYSQLFTETLMHDLEEDLDQEELDFAKGLMGKPATTNSKQRIDDSTPTSSGGWNDLAQRIKDAAEHSPFLFFGGTDEEAIFAVLLPLSGDANKISAIKQAYTRITNGPDTALVDELRDEMSGEELAYALELLNIPTTDTEVVTPAEEVVIPAEADRGADELSAELESPLPSNPSREQRRRHSAIRNARQRFRVIANTSVSSIPIDEYFSTQGATLTMPLPNNSTVRFSTTIPQSLHHGLRNVAGHLTLKTSPHILTPNTTIMLALNLTSYDAEHDSYRFTMLNLGRLGNEILIERQGSIGTEGLNDNQREGMIARFRRLGFQHSFSDEAEFDQVLIGLSEVPEAQLRQLGSLRFERRAVDTGPNGSEAAGHYDPNSHTLRLFDKAYTAGVLRLGRSSRPLTYAANAVVHEVGHALDHIAGRTTTAAAETADATARVEEEAAWQALFAEFGSGGRRYTRPHRNSPQRARYNQLRAAVRNAESAARVTRSTLQTAQAASLTYSGNSTFRRAAIQDGGPAGRQFPTDYPNPSNFWVEYFAESFALFSTSPDLLRRIRPNVFAFMNQEFP